MTPAELLAAWDEQQTAFIEYREQRTRVMVDVIAGLAETLQRDDLRVLDLGCGPASLGSALLDRLPNAQVTGIDRDPVLLQLGREANRHGERLQLLDLDLRDPEWTSQLPDGPYDAAFSATALHWIQPDQLVSLYQRLAKVLAAGAVFMNGDQLYFDHTHCRFLDDFTKADRERIRLAHLEAGALSWEDWWQRAEELPSLQSKAAERERRWATSEPVIKVSADFHLTALRAAGFTETAQIYQWFDDRVIFGRLPAN